MTGDLAAVADADVVFVALKAYSLPAIAPQLGRAAGSGRGGDLGPERHSLVVLPVAPGGPLGDGGLTAWRASIPAG